MPKPTSTETRAGNRSTEAKVWQLGVIGLAEGFGSGRISPLHALAAYRGRMEAVNPSLKAVVATDWPGAEQAAAASTERWSCNRPLGPLDGVPVVIKDSLAVKGLTATWGSKLYERYVPEWDELPVARLRAAGAVIVGKTNVPEFTITGHTDNPLFGTTGNPWNPSLTPGGSSGGTVAAVAAGLAAAGLGTDGGGSTRRPAALTGLVGLKPSTGRIARCNGLPVVLTDFEVIGPIGRTTADVAALYRVLAGPDPRDRNSLAFVGRDANPELDRDVPGLRILFVPRFGDSPVERTVADSVAKAAADLAALGHQVEEGTPPFDPEDFNQSWPVISRAGVAWSARGKPWEENCDGPSVDSVRAGQAYSAIDFVEALDLVRNLRADLGAAFEDWDVILTPSSATLPWPAGDVFPSQINGLPAGPRDHAVFTGFVNAAGYPAISIPCDPSPEGMPIGFQMVGRFGGEDLLLALAAQYEKAHPWAHRWPGTA